MSAPSDNSTVSDPEVEPDADTEVTNAPPDSPQGKATRYLGLLMAIGFVVLMFWPFRPYPIGSKHLDRTIVAHLLRGTEMAQFVSLHKSGCLRQPVEERMCRPDHMPTSFFRSRPHIPFKGPGVWDLVFEYERLRERDAVSKGFPAHFSYDYKALPMTPQQRVLVDQITEMTASEVAAFQTFLYWFQLAMYAMFIFIGVLGIVYRQALGGLALAPFRAILGLGEISAAVAKDIHKKI